MKKVKNMSRKAEATKNEELEKSKALINRAFRKGQNIIEKMICQHLLQATFSSDLKTVVPHVYAAATKFKVLHPNSEIVDYEMLKTINIMLDSIIRRIQYKSYFKDGYHWQYGYRVSWGLDKTEENYNRFVLPWIVPLEYIERDIKRHLRNATKLTHKRYFGTYDEESIECPTVLEYVNPKDREKTINKWIGKKCPYCNRKIGKYEVRAITGNFVFEKPRWSFFYEMTEHLTHSGFNLLVESFKGWALSTCHEVAAKVGANVSERVFDAERKFFAETKEEEK